MTYQHDDSGNRQRAEALLADLLEEAKDIAVLKLLLGRAPSTGPRAEWLSPGMVTGIHAYEDSGGWRCDLTLGGAPPGVGDLIRSPGTMRDRHAAETHAVFVLCEAFMVRPVRPAPVAEAPPAPAVPEPPAAPVAAPVPAASAGASPDVAFEYDGQAVAISPRMVRQLREAGMDHVNERYVRKRLAEIRRDISKGAPMTPSAIEGLTPDARRAFLTVCTMAALRGIARWPEGDEPLPVP